MWRSMAECMRYIQCGHGIQQHGRAWRYMVGAVCISVYLLHGGREARYAVGVGQHSRKEARYTNATRDILVYDIRTQYTTAIARASQRPGACIACACACACVILLYYYNIIILLYYYIIIFIYTQYIQYIQYT